MNLVQKLHQINILNNYKNPKQTEPTSFTGILATNKLLNIDQNFSSELGKSSLTVQKRPAIQV